MSANPQSAQAHRRKFLLTTAALTASLGSHWSASAVDATSAVTLQPLRQDTFRIRLDIEIQGNVNVPKNPLVSRDSDVKLPIKSAAHFDFEERLVRPAGDDGRDYVTQVQRHYHSAKSDTELNRRKSSVTLRDSVRSTIVRRELLPAVIFSTTDYFHRDELELLHTPVSSVAVDELLPTSAVQQGDRYRPTADAMMSVLNVSAVQSTDVEAEVVSLSDSEARIQFRGEVHGSVDGVPTIVRTAGKLTFDRKERTSVWLAMAIHETREPGKAEPGFDVAGTVKMVRKPTATPSAESLKTPVTDLTAPVPRDRLYVNISSDHLGFSAMMDRPWRMMTDISGTAMMRMIVEERSIAQCDFRPLAALQPGEQWTLEAFQQDVKRTLGDQLTGLVGGDQQVSETGLRVMRVTAEGAVENVPIRWILLHFSDDFGHRMLATFTMEAEQIDAFAAADEQLIGSLQFGVREETDENAIARDGNSVLQIANESQDLQSASDQVAR